ncbi:hypothetical protein [Achromobacter sp.]|uniref:hypothetical protein n=1 Tax=Achromobacter sp. TaxID=134375 RepID=UPI0028B19860|nr:hypothetical protein [Achromobacter sp.]
MKNQDSRAIFPIMILVTALFLLLVPYAYWFSGSYALVDDYSFMVRGLPDMVQWLSIGRPGTYLYMDFVNKVLRSNLEFARIMALLLLAITSLTIYASMRHRGQVAALAVAAALAIPASYSVHLSIVWINTGSSLVSLILATLAYGVGYDSRRRIVAAVVLFTLSGLFYQPTACIFFVFHLLDWLLVRRERMKWSDLWPFAIGGVGLAIIFISIKITVMSAMTPPTWSGRGALLYDVWAKVEFLTERLLPFAASPVIPPTMASVVLSYIGLASMIILAGMRDFAGRGLVGFLLTVGVTAAYLIAAELPILIVNDSWASARTIVPWVMLSTFLLAWVLYALLSRRVGEGALVVIVAMSMVGIGWWNGKATKRYLITPAIAEMNYFTAEVVKGVSRGFTDFAVVMPPPGPFIPKFIQYEFAQFSSSANWTPPGMLIMSQRRLALPAGSLKLVTTSRDDVDDCACYVIDMRPLWNEYRERFKQPAEVQPYSNR